MVLFGACIAARGIDFERDVHPDSGRVQWGLVAGRGAALARLGGSRFDGDCHRVGAAAAFGQRATEGHDFMTCKAKHKSAQALAFSAKLRSK